MLFRVTDVHRSPFLNPPPVSIPHSPSLRNAPERLLTVPVGFPIWHLHPGFPPLPALSFLPLEPQLTRRILQIHAVASFNLDIILSVI